MPVQRVLFLVVVVVVLASSLIGRGGVRADVEQLFAELPAPSGATTSGPKIFEPNNRVLEKQGGSGHIGWTFDESITSLNDGLVLIDDHFRGLGYERLYNGPFSCRETSTGNTYYGNEEVVWQADLSEDRIHVSLTWSSERVAGMGDGEIYKVRSLPYRCPD